MNSGLFLSKKSWTQSVAVSLADIKMLIKRLFLFNCFFYELLACFR